VVAALGALLGVLAAVSGVVYIYVPFGRTDPSPYFTNALANITIALGFPVADARTPEHLEPVPAAATPAPAVALSPLPPARSAAGMEAEPVLWQLVLDQPVTGRHARAETAVTETTETSVRADGDEGQLRRAA
jgi:hypothetical protein